jgi:hypothetical protein
VKDDRLILSADPSLVATISHSDRKSDPVDAEKLARYARLVPKLAVLLHRIWVTQKPYVPFYAVAAFGLMKFAQRG